MRNTVGGFHGSLSSVGDELVGGFHRRPAFDRGRAFVELGERVGVVRRQALESVVGVVGQEAVVRGQHHGFVAWPAGHLLDLGVDLAVVLLGAGWTAVGRAGRCRRCRCRRRRCRSAARRGCPGRTSCAPIAPTVRRGHHEPASGLGAVSARHRERDLDESERARRGEQDGQRRAAAGRTAAWCLPAWSASTAATTRRRPAHRTPARPRGSSCGHAPPATACRACTAHQAA